MERHDSARQNYQKRGQTAVLTIREDRTKLHPWLIFQGSLTQRSPTEEYPSICRERGISCRRDTSTGSFRTNFPHRSSTEPQRLLVYDSCITEAVRAELAKRYIDHAVIPEDGHF